MVMRRYKKLKKQTNDKTNDIENRFLMYATKFYKVKIIKFFIERGADINKITDQQFNCIFGYGDMVKDFLY